MWQRQVANLALITATILTWFDIQKHSYSAGMAYLPFLSAIWLKVEIQAMLREHAKHDSRRDREKAHS